MNSLFAKYNFEISLSKKGEKLQLRIAKGKILLLVLLSGKLSFLSVENLLLDLNAFVKNGPGVIENTVYNEIDVGI